MNYCGYRWRWWDGEDHGQLLHRRSASSSCCTASFCCRVWLPTSVRHYALVSKTTKLHFNVSKLMLQSVKVTCQRGLNSCDSFPIPLCFLPLSRNPGIVPLSVIAIYKPRVKTPLEALSHISFSWNETPQLTGAHHPTEWVLYMQLANHIIGHHYHLPEEGHHIWKAEY